MSQRAVQKRLEEALTEGAQAAPFTTACTTEPQAAPPEAMLLEMVSFADLEELLLGCCRNPANRVAVSHYVRWMSEVSGSWEADATLLELLAIISIAAECPRLGEGRMP